MEFADFRTKKAVMEAARRDGGLKFNDILVLFFPDLPPEALQQRKLLCPISQWLIDAAIQYHWSLVGNLIVHYQGKQLIAYDFDSGITLLWTLNLEPPSEMPERKSPKRKLELTPSPQKWSKIPVLNK